MVEKYIAVIKVYLPGWDTKHMIRLFWECIKYASIEDERCDIERTQIAPSFKTRICGSRKMFSHLWVESTTCGAVERGVSTA